MGAVLVVLEHVKTGAGGRQEHDLVAARSLSPETLADPAVQAKLREFALLRADITDNTPEQRELMQRYRVFGPPTLLFFDREGRLRKNRVTGFVDAAEFLAILEGLGSNLSQE